MQKSTRSFASMSAALGIAIASMMGGGGVASNALNEAQARPGSDVSPTKAKASKTKSTPTRAMASIFGGNGWNQFNNRNPGPGWSNRQVQRMARKKRAVKANRKNHKG